MDADGLPLIGSSVDYQKVSPISQKKTVEYINHFIIHTAGFLNRFSTVCEEKLASLSTRIERLSTQMSLLEGKINSIPGLANVMAPTTTQSTQEPATTTTNSQDVKTPSQVDADIDHSDPSESKAADISAVSQPPTKTVSQDPRYVQFFKMLSFGIPLNAVKQKMSLEGLDPNLLDNPSSPMVGDSTVSNQTSDEDFTDEDSEESSDDSAAFSG